MQLSFKNFPFGKLFCFVIPWTLDMVEGSVEIPRKLANLFNDNCKGKGGLKIESTIELHKKSPVQKVTNEDFSKAEFES